MVSEHAATRAGRSSATSTVEFEQSDELDTGVFRVRSSVVAADAPAHRTEGIGRPRVVLQTVPERVVLLTRPVTVVGRGADADLQLADTGVSRAHAELRLDGGHGARGRPPVDERHRPERPARADRDPQRRRPPRPRCDHAGLPVGGLMGSALVVAAVKYGLLALLWLFVVLAFRTVRNDLFGARSGVGTPAAARPVAQQRRAPRRARPHPAAGRAAAPPGGSSSPRGPGGHDHRPRRGARHARPADDSTLVLTDDYASSRHARLVPGDGAWLVEDLGSTNGTYLGAPRSSGRRPVPLGQQIRIGKTVLELRR
jgi:pSer/pThr/pTyr-binding forkhead associated (FHA) protein